MDGSPALLDAFGRLGLLPAWPWVPESCPGPQELLFQAEQHRFGNGLGTHMCSLLDSFI